MLYERARRDGGKLDSHKAPTGAEYLALWLITKGVRTVAGIPGSAVLPLYRALAETPRIRHILPRHEQGAGFIAQGMARSTGQPAVCIATSGPGATNLLTPLADAYRDSVPLLALVGQVATPGIGKDSFQEIDIQGMADPISRAVYVARRAADLPAILVRAWQQLTSGRPAPVVIELPKDVQEASVGHPEALSLPPGQPVAAGGADSPAPSDEAIAEATAELQSAQRPVLLIGGGVIAAGGGEAARQLAEQIGMPVASTLMGLGALPDDHPQYLGLIGMHGDTAANRAVEQADLIVIAGARLSDRTTGLISEFCPHARVIHIDIDARELGKRLPADLPIHADARSALQALASASQSRAAASQHATTPWLSVDRDPPPGTEHPKGLIRHLATQSSKPTIVATDVGQHQMWAAQGFPFERPRQWLTSGGLGTMGFGLPTAMGAALANPDHRVLCLTSDGSLLMNIQEFATLAELELDVHIVLLDNRGLGLVRQQQDLFYGGCRFASSHQQPTDFCALARAFGLAAHDLPQEASQDPLGTILEKPGPSLLRIPVDSDQRVLPIVPPGAANRDALGNEEVLEGGLSSESDS
ncbi:MAG: biosynthetic-type acetolactate synthase large subunit [Halorhodospira sp.]